MKTFRLEGGVETIGMNAFDGWLLSVVVLYEAVTFKLAGMTEAVVFFVV